MLLTVAAENFLPFRHRVEYPVAGLGLVRVLGDNRVSGAADSNGVGKSALFSAVAFGRYGRTLCGRSADDVCNRFSRGPTVVELVERDDLTGAEWRVVRGRRPARAEVYERAGDGWRRALEDGDARDVDAWVEARTQTWAVFRNAVVFDRFERFARADQGDQMRMLDAIHGVDFRAALDRARSWRAVATETAATARVNASLAERAAAEAGVAVAELEAVRDAFRAEAAGRVRAAEAEVAAAREAEGAAALRAAALGKAERVLAKARAAAAAVDGASSALAGASAALDRAERDADRAAAREDEVARQVEALVAAGRCPTCRRVVHRAADVAGEFDVEHAAAASAARAARATASTARAAERRASAAFDTALGGRTAAEVDGAVLRLTGETSAAARAALDREVRAASDRSAAAARALEAARGLRWEGADALAGARRRAKDAAGEVDARRREAVTAERYAVIAAYWVEAFGDRGIRSVLLGSVEAFLTERAAAHLEALAAGEARLTVSSTTALKGGGTRERLSIVPEWSWGGVGARAESEGQDGRSALALFAAIQDLAEASSPRPFGLKVMDEPGAGLDARGIELFGAWVRAETARRGTTFLVTHSQDLADAVDPDETWTVVLEAPGDARLERGAA